MVARSSSSTRDPGGYPCLYGLLAIAQLGNAFDGWPPATTVNSAVPWPIWATMSAFLVTLLPAAALGATGSPATTEQVAAATGLTSARVRDALSLAAARPASIDTRIANHVPAPPAPGIDHARDAALVAWCWAAIRRLHRGP